MIKKDTKPLVLEFVGGKRIVNSPTNEDELEEFFSLREEYKENCVVNPWIEKPKESIPEEVRTNFEKWKEISFKLYPTHPFRKNEDQKLIDEAARTLIKGYKNAEREFQHGHFGASDLYKISNNEVIILSNLYWSWKPPFYDAVFDYHWFMYGLASIKILILSLLNSKEAFGLQK